MTHVVELEVLHVHDQELAASLPLLPDFQKKVVHVEQASQRVITGNSLVSHVFEADDSALWYLADAGMPLNYFKFQEPLLVSNPDMSRNEKAGLLSQLPAQVLAA